LAAIGILVEEADHLAEHGVEAAGARGRGAEDPRHRLVPVLEHLLEHTAAQLVLAREVVEQRRLADADCLRDVAQRCTDETVAREQACGLIQDALGDVGAAGAFGGHAGSDGGVGSCLPLGRHGGKDRGVT